MADYVQRILERMVPALEDLQERDIFSAVCALCELPSVASALVLVVQRSCMSLGSA